MVEGSIVPRELFWVMLISRFEAPDETVTTAERSVGDVFFPMVRVTVVISPAAPLMGLAVTQS
jgi:hypothetical protein